MTSTPSGSKGKQKTPEGLGIPTDWRVCAINQPTSESLAVLDLPFETTPKAKDTILVEYTARVCHLVGGQKIAFLINKENIWRTAPFTGYYACYKEALLALLNAFGVCLRSAFKQETSMNISD